MPRMSDYGAGSAALMDQAQALKLAEKLWPKRGLACAEYLGGKCRVEEIRRGGPWKVLAEADTWEELFRNAARRVTVQQDLI